MNHNIYKNLLACISGCWKILKLLFEKMRNFIDKQMQEKNIILSSITSAIKFNNTQILNIFINNNVHTLTNCRNKLIFYLHEGSTGWNFVYRGLYIFIIDCNLLQLKCLNICYREKNLVALKK